LIGSIIVDEIVQKIVAKIADDFLKSIYNPDPECSGHWTSKRFKKKAQTVPCSLFYSRGLHDDPMWHIDCNFLTHAALNSSV
jgi:hypothetical protein